MAGLDGGAFASGIGAIAAAAAASSEAEGLADPGPWGGDDWQVGGRVPAEERRWRLTLGREAALHCASRH